MLKIFTKLFGTKFDRDVKKYTPVVDETLRVYETLQSISSDELRDKTNQFRARIKDHLAGIDEDIRVLHEEVKAEGDFGLKEDLFKQIDELKKEKDEHLEEVLNEILPEAFAVVKEVARRFKDNDRLQVTATDFDRDLAAKKSHVTIQGDQATFSNKWIAGGGEIVWDMVHYDVQLIGGMVLHDGKIAEMATGEGKTLVATLPAYLNGLAGEGVHLITVNDYLARRDCEWVGPIFEFLFLTVDCIDKYRPNSPERKQAYLCDVTYGTNSEFGFDYLRDNMVRSPTELVQRKHHFSMIDEVDSVLVDDARTPLIISGPIPQGAEDLAYIHLRPEVERLFNAQKKVATEYLAEAKSLIKDGSNGYNEGEGGLSLLRAYRALPKYRPLTKFLSEDGVRISMQKAENFYMQEQSKNMHLVDEPLLFTIDEKNRNVDLTERGSEFLARGGDDPNLFVLPDIGTSLLEIEENEALDDEQVREAKQNLIQEYGEKTRRLHAVNQLLKAFTLFEKDEEYVVLDGQVKIVDEQTGRMMEGRRYSDGLHQALEAKENVKIGELTQTYATVTLQNYFRMYHKLAGMTGTAETEANELWEIYKLDVVVIPTNRPIVRDDREDMVFKTAREKFNAVIDEIVSLSEADRPILVGTTSVDISEKLSRMLKLRNINHNVLNAKQHQREAEIVAEAGKAGNVTIATNMAGRGTDIKINDHVKKVGGLAIIGTERHDSRRVDRQLMGRAGRQGDPGSSQFFVSLEDNLMRLFRSERIAKLMDRMGHKDGEVIQHSMVTKSIERAQKKVEENNFGIRKRLLEYDDVMNIQREAIYEKRRNALFGDRLSVDLNNMFHGLSEALVSQHKQNGSFDSFRRAALQTLGMDPKMDAAFFAESSDEEAVETFQQEFFDFYLEKSDRMIESLLPVIKNVHDNEGHRYRYIALPITDGSGRELPISADLAKAVETGGKSIVEDIEKTVTLALIDDHWKEHLRTMDELKESVQAASFEQKDPLVVYKMEAYDLFEQLIFEINVSVTSFLSKAKLLIKEPSQVREARTQRTDLSGVNTNRGSDTQEAAQAAAEGVGRSQRPKPETFKREEKKVGRNESCPCGSGKKFKHCHGRK